MGRGGNSSWAAGFISENIVFYPTFTIEKYRFFCNRRHRLYTGLIRSPLILCIYKICVYIYF